MYFLYKAIDQNRKIIKSFIEADNEKDVLKLTKKLNINLIYVKQVKSVKKEKIKSNELLIFTRLLSRLIKSHISVVQSLKIIQENTENTSFKNIINNIIGYIEKGDSLSKALEKYQYIFSSFYCAVVKAGEHSGKLGPVLELLYKYLQTSETTKKKFQTALLYPVFVLSTGILVLSLIFIFVVPQFRALFNMFDSKLPPLTEFLFTLSSFVKNNFLILLISIITGITIIIIFLNTGKGMHLKDRLIFKIPLIGKLIKESFYTKFCQILAILVQSNVNILHSFQIISDIMNNNLVKNKIEMIEKNIKNGKSITDAFILSRFFPSTIIQLIKAGEESSELDKMLESAARFYEENLSVKIEIFSSLLQPVLIILIGIFIASIIISIFLPIFQLGSIIK